MFNKRLNTVILFEEPERVVDATLYSWVVYSVNYRNDIQFKN